MWEKISRVAAMWGIAALLALIAFPILYLLGAVLFAGAGDTAY